MGIVSWCTWVALFDLLHNKILKHMKEKVKKISGKNLLPKIPLFNTVLIFLALDYWKASNFLWGVVAAIVVIWWIVVFYSYANIEQIDIFKEEETKK